MSGQCYSCGDAFGFFKKEHGCKNCGYAFCSNCLNKKANIPKLNNEKHKVCLKCYNIITKKVKPPDQTFQAPDAYYKRVAALEDGDSTHKRTTSPARPAHTEQTSKYKYLNKEDVAIAERLDKLKEARKREAKPVPTQKEMEERLAKLKADRAPPPTEEDMRARLAELKGQDPATAKTKHTFETDRRSEQTQIDDLMKQYFEEVQIDEGSASTDKTDDAQNNLNLATANESKHMTDKNIPSDDQDLDEVNRQIQQSTKKHVDDAAKAVAGLEEDKDLMDKVKELKKQRKIEAKRNIHKQGNDNKEKLDESESENEEDMTNKVIQQILEDSRREEAEELAGLTDQIENLPKPPPSDAATASNSANSGKTSNISGARKYDKEEDDDELPWCCICNNDASLRCLGCDGDLYCNRCYRQGHPRYELEDHRTVPFQPQ